MRNELLNAILYLGSTLLHTIGGDQLINWWQKLSFTWIKILNDDVAWTLIELNSNSTKLKLTIGSRFNPISNEKKWDVNRWKSWKYVCEYGVPQKKKI
jgi:hypothetical protein